MHRETDVALYAHAQKKKKKKKNQKCTAEAQELGSAGIYNKSSGGKKLEVKGKKKKKKKSERWYGVMRCFCDAARCGTSESSALC